MKKFILPTFDSIEDMTPQQISIFKQCGFCYVRINEKVESNLMEISTAGRKFFNQPESKKQQSTLKVKAKGYEINEGYGSYSNAEEKNAATIQNYVYSGGPLPEPFLPKKTHMDEVTGQLVTQIALPLLKKIFELAGIAENYASVANNYSAILSSLYYPRPENSASESKLNPHRDTALITVLFIDETGLEVYFENEWHPINPKRGYVVLNLGKTLELMTGKEYIADLHRVHPPADRDRLSIAMFLGPNPNIPLIDYKNGKQMYANFKEFSKAQTKVMHQDQQR